MRRAVAPSGWNRDAAMTKESKKIAPLCLSLWQPWAQLLVLGLKKFETRSWGTEYRGPLFIHASAFRPPRSSVTHLADDLAELERRGYAYKTLARGQLVGTVELVDVRRTEYFEPLVEKIGLDEMLRGNWAPGRFAWSVVEPRCWTIPIPCRGRQKLFSLPPAVLFLEPMADLTSGPLIRVSEE